MHRSKVELNNLKNTDIYSLMMFALYKLRSIPEYSTLSELAYILTKEDMLKICEYFGGLTIKIPTIEELESIVYSLVLYQYVNIEGKDYDEACKLIGHESCDLRKVKTDYKGIVDILNKYDFSNRGDTNEF